MENNAKVKITNRKLVENIQLIAQVSQKQLPPKVSFTLSRNTDHIDSVLKTYNKENEKLIDKYVKNDEHGKPELTDNRLDFVYKEDGDKEKFKADRDELLDIENEIEIRKIKLDDLRDIQFSAAEFRAIDYMIEE